MYLPVLTYVLYVLRTRVMKRKGRPSLAESLAKRPVDLKQRTLSCNLSFGLSPVPTASPVASGSTKSTSAASVASSGPGTSRSRTREEANADLNLDPDDPFDSVAIENMMACGYSDVGSSASACGTGFDVLQRDYRRLQSQFEAFHST